MTDRTQGLGRDVGGTTDVVVPDLVSQVLDYAIIRLDPQGIIETWNLGATRLKGHTAEQAVGRSFAMFYPEEDRRDGLPIDLLVQARRDGRVQHEGWRVRRDGSRFWADVTITALHDASGAVTGYAKVTRDLTERHRLEEALRASEERHRLLVEQVQDYAIIALDPQGSIVSWNLGAERVKGYTADEARGRSFAMFYTEDDQAAGLPTSLLEQARRDGRVEHTGWRVRQDGSRFWADVVITALHDDGGALTGYAKVTRDLTERHALEQQLRASEERLRLLVGQVADYAIIALDPQGTIETWNLGAERVKGYTAEEIVGRHFAVFYTAEDRARGLPLDLLVEAREHGRTEHRGWRVRKDGSRFWGDVVISALHDDAGRLTGFAKVTRDRSDLKALEDAQDAFYAAFQHDFRTPVMAITGFVDAMRDADEETRGFLIDRVEANAERLMAMVEGLVEFARQRQGRASMVRGDIDLGAVARSVVHDLSPSAGPGRVVVEEAVALARADGGAMHRVLTNLVVNALKYSDPTDQVRVGFARPAPGRTAVTVSDLGRGIHRDDLATIFDSFQRGRLAAEDGGTGLGLTSVRDLVEQQEGTVTIRSEPGEGTTVTVDLPAPGPEAAGGQPSSSSADVAGGSAGQPSG